jgi:ubiquitin-conjugating enzyme E2 Q
METEPEKQGYSVEPVDDNMYHWELRFFNFDKKEPIAQDLKNLKADHILLHITFPPTYPLNPPFVRVIRPRFAFRTGHVR